MDRLNRRLLLSASDLVNHAACEYLSGLEHAATLGAVRPDRAPSPDLMARINRGFAHEHAFLAQLEAQGRSVCRIETDRTTNAGLLVNAVQTQSAIAAGFDVVYQPTFLHDDGGFLWQGHGDFAVRLENGSYEIYDTKLAHSVKPGVLIQLAVYSEMLGAVQGVTPERFHVVLGNNEIVSYRTAEVLPLMRAFRERFERDLRVGTFVSRPEPVAHCEVCDWKSSCELQWQESGHLSLVRGMRPQYRQALDAAGITTLTRLAVIPPGTRVPGLADSVVWELHAQARLQQRGERTGELLYELRTPRVDRGLAKLPAPRRADLFLDFEANALERDPMFAYLFAVVEASDPRQPTVQTYWADSERTERSNVRALARRIAEARAVDPEMHVYHWGSFDQALMRTLLERHNIPAADFILDAFVDLHAMFRDGGRLSDRSTSLKVAERLWSTEVRASAGMDGASSIALREEYLQTRSRVRRSQLRSELTQYCSDDTVQLVAARAFLLQKRRELAASGMQPVPVAISARDARRNATEGADVSEPAPERIGTVEFALRALVPDDGQNATPLDQARRAMADLIDWHRRERKPEWRDYFKRLEMDTRACKEDDVALGDLRLQGELSREEIKPFTVRGLGFDPERSVIERYAYDWSQDHRLHVGEMVVEPGSEELVTIVDIDTVLGEVVVKRSRERAIAHGMTRALRNLVPGAPPAVGTLQASLLRTGEALLRNQMSYSSPYQLAEQLLRGAGPRLRSTLEGTPLLRPGEDQTEAVARLVCDLDRSVLAVQGPPGSGKTYAAARAIRAYLATGSASRPPRIGVMASSHSVIANVLDELARQAAADGQEIGIAQLVNGMDRATHPMVRVNTQASSIWRAIDLEQVHVVGGTAWFFSRPENTAAFDLLVVEEAGQISLADTVASAPAARNMLLVGDPAQLTQPIRGNHPEAIRTSPIGKIIGDRDTIALEQGVFFSKTRRLGRNCAFISEQFYEGRLEPHRKSRIRQVHGIDTHNGLLYIPVEPVFPNRSASTEEAEVVLQLIERLSSCVLSDGTSVRPLTPADVLVITPFNAQAHRIRQIVGDGVKVLTVDKAQGREAPVVIYSMASSGPEASPRGSEFLLSRNRLNVAVSRGQALSVIVAAPRVFTAVVRQTDQIRRMGSHLRFIEMASGIGNRPEYAGQLPRLDFAARVRSARQEQHMTQRELAIASGCDERSIQRLEAGNGGMIVSMRVAQALGWESDKVASVLAGRDPNVWDAPSVGALVRSLEAER
ncbi:MAG: TM0106 family RecB-like putative nuclease [Acidimicrobiia bacterium]